MKTPKTPRKQPAAPAASQPQADPAAQAAPVEGAEPAASEDATPKPCREPSVNELALLSATLAGSSTEPADKLAGRAFDIWCACDIEILARRYTSWDRHHEKARIAKVNMCVEESETFLGIEKQLREILETRKFVEAHKNDGIQLPESFPVDFDTMLSLFMPKATGPDRLRDFRHFLASLHKCDPITGTQHIETMERLKGTKIRLGTFAFLYDLFSAWKKQSRSKTNKANAQSGHAKKGHKQGQQTSAVRGSPPKGKAKKSLV